MVSKSQPIFLKLSNELPLSAIIESYMIEHMNHITVLKIHFSQTVRQGGR